MVQDESLLCAIYYLRGVKVGESVERIIGLYKFDDGLDNGNGIVRAYYYPQFQMKGILTDKCIIVQLEYMYAKAINVYITLISVYNDLSSAPVL